MGHHLTSLALEVLAILAAVALVTVAYARWRRDRADLRLVAASVVGVIAFALAVADLRTSLPRLNRARLDSVGVRAGLERCIIEDSAARLVPFLNWVKARLPASAVYVLGPTPLPLDSWCLTLFLLPALPDGPGGTPRWTITLGTIPRDLQARIVRHEVRVEQFAPGLVLAADHG